MFNINFKIVHRSSKGQNLYFTEIFQGNLAGWAEVHTILFSLVTYLFKVDVFVSNNGLNNWVSLWLKSENNWKSMTAIVWQASCPARRSVS